MMDEQLRTYRKLSETYSLVRLKGKKPIESEWQKFCSFIRPYNQIGFKPGDNAGIACGQASGLLVLDVDDLKLFDKTCRERGWGIPHTLTIETGSGNLHYYFHYPDTGKTYGNKAFKEDGFDVRGHGGIIVAPGSLHPGTKKPYKIIDDIQAADPPQWLLGLYQPDTPEKDISPISLSEEALEEKIGTLKTTKVIKLIREGKPRGERSEAMMTVINSLVSAGFTDGDILLVFERYPIGEKYREKGNSKDKWLLAQITKGKAYTQTPPDSRLNTFTAAELQQMDIPELEWLIDGILPIGLTLLAAPPKAGKTRLASQFALAVAMGTPLFDKSCPELHEVLFLCLEDSPRRIRDRLKQMLPQGCRMPKTLHLTTELIDNSLHTLREWLQKHEQAKLVIIDVYARIKGPRNGKDIYQLEYDDICRIKAIADEFSIGIVLIHHTNKGQNHSNIHEKVSGTNALTGACDTLMTLQRISIMQADATLHITGRDVEDQELALSFDRAKGTWKSEGLGEIVFITKERTEIRTVLKYAGKPLGPKEISKRLNKDYGNIRVLLHKMLKDNQLTQVNRGLYCINNVNKETGKTS